MQNNTKLSTNWDKFIRYTYIVFRITRAKYIHSSTYCFTFDYHTLCTSYMVYNLISFVGSPSLIGKNQLWEIKKKKAKFCPFTLGLYLALKNSSNSKSSYFDLMNLTDCQLCPLINLNFWYLLTGPTKRLTFIVDMDIFWQIVSLQDCRTSRDIR